MASLVLVLVYSYFKGRRIIHTVNVSFNEHKKIYLQGDQFELIMEVPRQNLFEMRELSVTVEYYSVIRKTLETHTHTLHMRRRMNGKEVVTYPLNFCDAINIQIKEIQLDGLCGVFHFKKPIDFFETIYVLPMDLPIYNGYISKTLEDYGNFKYIGSKEDGDDVEPILYLDIENLLYEEEMMVRSLYLPLVFSVSNSMLQNGYKHKITFGEELYIVENWNDYFLIFKRLFELIRGELPMVDCPHIHRVTHAITTKLGLPIPFYYGKTIALIYDENDIEEDFSFTEYVRVTNIEDDIFHLTL
ncbi:MAG: hypothetical protein MJ087_05460 [Lachnospiraceae bacterium]|nr:hypothetical protein [Lachnospiraceae bacterium]